jgi:hypothetical protein
MSLGHTCSTSGSYCHHQYSGWDPPCLEEGLHVRHR